MGANARSDHLPLPGIELEATPARKLRTKNSHTEAAYRIDQGRYLRWCMEPTRNLDPHDPASVGAYLRYLAVTPPRAPDGRVRTTAAQPRSHALSTIRRRLAGIASYFIEQHLDDPRNSVAVKEALKDIRTDSQVRLPEETEPAPTEVLQRILKRMDEDPPLAGPARRRYLRDRALFLMLYAGAMTRQEVRMLRVRDITVFPEGLQCRINRSEYERRAREVIILRGADERTCPVRALARHLAESQIAKPEDYIFPPISDDDFPENAPLSKVQFWRMFHARVRAANLDPRKVTPRAFRAGVAFQVGSTGGTLADVLALTGHAEARSVLKPFQDGKAWANHPANHLRL